MKSTSRSTSLVSSPSSLVLPLALAAAATASATDGRYREYVVGERAGGMGGAAIAVAGDVDAIFYNPAGLSRSKGDSISLSANLYGLQKFESSEDADGSSSFVSIPGAMGGVMKFSDEITAGFGVFTPKQEKHHVIAHAEDIAYYNTDYTDQTVWFGPAVSWAPAESRFSFGAGVFGVYRDFTKTRSMFVPGAIPGIIPGSASVNEAYDLTGMGLLATLGAQANLGNGWFAGATLQTPSLRLYDDGTCSRTASVRWPGVVNGDFTQYSTDVEANNYIPLQLGIGIGWTNEGKYGFALDATYHPGASYDLAKWNFNGEHESARIHLHSVIDVSLGGEYVVAEKYPIRAGFYTGLSGVEVSSDPESDDFATSDVDIYGVTCSVGRRSQNMSVNLGIDFAFGDGYDTSLAYDGENERTSCSRRVLLATVSTTYYF